MGRFKIWCESHLDTMKDDQIRQVWQDTFKALGIDGLGNKIDAAHTSLGSISFGHSARADKRGNTFHGKQAVQKRLENGQIFKRLEELNDPKLRQTIQATKRWLDTKDDGHGANGNTTVGTLLKTLFGDDTFYKYIGKDYPKADTAKAQVEPQPPKPDMGMGGEQPPAPDNSMDQNSPQPAPPGAPMGNMPGQQPQAAGGMMPGQPSNPMPPKPAGAEMGMF